MTARTLQRGTIPAGLIALLAALSMGALAAAAQPSHGIAMHGQPKYGPDFVAFDYINPDAPQGGRLIRAAQGSFDSLNPLIVMGQSAPGMRQYVYERTSHSRFMGCWPRASRRRPTAPGLRSQFAKKRGFPMASH